MKNINKIYKIIIIVLKLIKSVNIQNKITMIRLCWQKENCNKIQMIKTMIIIKKAMKTVIKMIN